MDINEHVQILRSKFNTRNPFRLAKELNIDVRHEKLNKILGYSDKHYRIQSIHINTYAPEELHSFICAHKLGHAKLHPHINTPFLATQTFFSINKIEKEANQFAMALLLPDEYENHERISFYRLAELSGISKSALNF